MPGTVIDGDRAISPAPETSWELPAEPASVGAIRNGVRAFAHDRGADASTVADVALAVTEAVTNAVLHAFVDRPAGTVRAEIRAAREELVVTVADDGRGMQPRADSPGLGLGLPTIGRLTAAMDMHAPAGGGTVLEMTFAAPGVQGPERPVARAAGESELLDAVARTVEGAWPGEGVERLVDLLVPGLADACALDVIGSSGRPQRFAGRIDGPDSARQSAWLAALRPRTDAPQSATRAALREGGVRVVELTREHIARITACAADAEQMEATGIRWWVVIPLLADGRLLGLIHFGMRPARGRPPRERLALLQAVADRAAGALVTSELIAELRRTRRRLERILDVLAEAVTVQDAAGNMVYVNDAAARLLGAASPGELVDATGAELTARFEITRADGTQVCFEDLPSSRLLAGLDAPPLLTRSVLRSTGQERWLLTKATLLDDGELLAVNIIEDVTGDTERPAAEADRDRLAAIVSSSTDAFISCDREGRITSWNAAAERVFGCAASEALGTPITRLAPPDREAFARDVLERTLRGEPVEACQAQLERRDGTSLDVELTAAAIRATDGTVTGVSAEVRDIGERRRAQQTVAHQTRILAAVRDALIETDLDFRILRWNPAAERLYGWKESEVIGRPVTEVLQTRLLDTDGETMLRTLAEDGHVVAEALQRTREGVEVNVEASVTALRDGAGAPVGYVSLDRDVRARRRLEERLREARQLEAIGRLAGGIAHDFNNLLTALLGYGDLVLDEPDLPPAVRADVEEMVRVGGRAGALTRQLLAFSRQQLLEPRAVDLNSIVRESTATLSRLAGAAVEIEHRLAADLAPAEVDAAQIEKVLLGLVENACEAMPGGGRLTIETANGAPGAEPLEGPAAGDYVVLTVSDTGRGMDGETRARVFEPYFTTKAIGAGLGLATAYGIVRQSGGEITVSSRPGSGSSFAVLLPCATPAATAPSDSTRAAGAGPTVLVVDDEVTIRTLMMRILRREGFTVLETGAPEQAIELARGASAGLSLLISDVILPGLSGGELSERIATLCPGVRILLVSGHPEDARVCGPVAGRRVAHLGKPFTPDMLMAKVREVLAAPA